jgi:hypothetical protein
MLCWFISHSLDYRWPTHWLWLVHFWHRNTLLSLFLWQSVTVYFSHVTQSSAHPLTTHSELRILCRAKFLVFVDLALVLEARIPSSFHHQPEPSPSDAIQNLVEDSRSQSTQRTDVTARGVCNHTADQTTVGGSCDNNLRYLPRWPKEHTLRNMGVALEPLSEGIQIIHNIALRFVPHFFFINNIYIENVIPFTRYFYHIWNTWGNIFDFSISEAYSSTCMEKADLDLYSLM